ncbi:Pectinesterase [Quillaja saponaria]|uniref:Pectinesterase n=1 Tax=Quillaja saponaria TaxID=32244 RepID=A0AAD7Q1Z5_QUISA|nr:Pectinesterase [Quillaja saponaria]
MGEDAQRRKRLTIIGVSSFLLVGMVVAVTVGVNLNQDYADTKSGNKSHEVSSSMKAIKTICQPTDYKQECVRSLHSAAGNTTDPKELIKVAFKVAMKKISEGVQKSIVFQELEKEPRAKKALDQCKELLDLSIRELQHSFDKVGEFDIMQMDDMLMDLKVWLSAAITYQETCIDGFQDTFSNAGEKMKAALKTSMEMSSNGLAIITSMYSVLTDLQLTGVGNRRLLQDEDDEDDDDNKLPVLGHGELPDWVDPGVRRLLAEQPEKIKADIVVAKDGSGKYKTIGHALEKVPKKGTKPFVIYIKEGVYAENVFVDNGFDHVVFIGDGPLKTRITGNLNYIDGTPTFKTATVAVQGDYFIAKDIGFENTAGPHKHQAVALRVQADMSIFYNCHMDGYQDTLYTHTKRQFYRDCTISGTIDFVFGDAAVVFQNCKFVVRKPLDNQYCIVTAQGRKERHQPSAIIFQNATIVSDPEHYAVRDKNKAYLGRPWKEFSRTIIMESFIGDSIQAEGWLPWNATFALKTLFYTEFNNRGPGADKAKRVTWRGIKTITPEHSVDFTPSRFLKGDAWIKDSGVPYTPGMMNIKPDPAALAFAPGAAPAAPSLAPGAAPALLAPSVAAPALAPSVAAPAQASALNSLSHSDETSRHTLKMFSFTF